MPDDINEYQKRLAKVIQHDHPEDQQLSMLSYPAMRDLKSNIPEISINLRDFYALQQCPVATLIAERNTTLGRTQLPSSRYIYEVKLLAGLAYCTVNNSDQKVLNQLAHWEKVKRASLSLVWADLVQTSHEIKYAMSSNHAFITGAENDGANRAINALTYLVALAELPLDDETQLEDNLRTLRTTALPAKVWRTQRLLGTELNQTTHWLNTYAAQLDCNSTKSRQKMEYLYNVFRLFFIQRIQPVAGMLNHYQYQLLPLYAQLNGNSHIKPGFKTMLARHQQDFEHYKHAMQQHIQLWQKLLKPCGMSPNMG